MTTRRLPRGALGADAVGIGNGAQVMHAGQVGAWRRQPARTTAGGQHQCVVRQHQPVIEPHVLHRGGAISLTRRPS